MRLQETILDAIKQENFESKEKNVFTLESDNKFLAFDDVQINIQGHKWESYIDFTIDVLYKTDECKGDNDTPPSSSFEIEDVEITFLTIEVDGLSIKLHYSFIKQVNEAIKKVLIFEIE